MFLRDSIGYLFYIPVYEGSLRILRKTNFNETPIQVLGSIYEDPAHFQLLSGGLAGIGGWLSICPLEVIKNRIQVDKTGHTRFSEIEVFFKRRKNFRSLWKTANLIYTNEGLKAFYRGGLTISIRGFTVNAVLFVMYENTLQFVESISGAAMIG